MARLIDSMITSLDGYAEDEHGHFGWGAPEDEGGWSGMIEEPRVGDRVVVLRYAAGC